MNKKKTIKPVPKRSKLVVGKREIVSATFQIYKDQHEALGKRSRKVIDGQKRPMQKIVRDLLDADGICNPKLVGL